MVKVYLSQSDIHLDFEKGTLVETALEKAGIKLNRSCGGQGTCGRCKVIVKKEEESVEEVLACKTKIESDIEIIVPILSQENVLVAKDSVCEDISTQVEAGANTGTEQTYGLAVDVGTTAVEVHLVEIQTGHVLCKVSRHNAQVQCGKDVISRIIYAEEGGLQELQSLVISTINELAEKVFQKTGIVPNRMTNIALAGNTTMSYLLFGKNPSVIRHAPYITSAEFFPETRAGDLGLNINPNANVYCLPCVASFVGGDIVSGVLSSGFYREQTMTMFIDIGTNGEIVFGNSEFLLSASCSAGPAFEGGGVECGTWATVGAIEQIKINPRTKEPEEMKIIGNVKPIGICGSGIIDAMAELFRTNIIAPNGRINRDLNHPRIRTRDNVAEYVLVCTKDSGSGKDIVITENDIDNIMRAKAAIYAAFRVLLQEAGQNFSAIDNFIIAGGLGNYLNLQNAIAIGLFPDISRAKFKYIGNSSVVGARMALCSEQEKRQCESIARSMVNIDLCDHRNFMPYYVSEMFLPHTD